MEVEKAGLDVDEFGAEGEVERGEDIVGAEGGQAGEEYVGGDLQAGLSESEDVFGREDGEGADEEGEGDEGEEEDGAEDGRGEGLDFEVVGGGVGFGGSVEGDGFGEEDGAEEY